VINKIWARHGAVAVVPPLDGFYGSTEFPCFRVNTSSMSGRWLHWLTRWRPFWDSCAQQSRGTSGKSRIRPENFLKIEIPLPPTNDQERIASNLDAIATRLEECGGLQTAIQEEQQQLLLSRAAEIAINAPREPMDQVAPLVRRAVEIKPGASYAELGIRSFGKGTFHKPALTAEEVGSKRLFRIQPGDLLFSNVFSWEGAIAVAQPEDKARFGTHRFITCVPDPAKATAEFLCHWFLTDEGMTYIRAASPGAAGRNRTLGIKKLMAIPVPLPPLAKQQEFSALRRQILAARALHKDLPAELDALQAALLDQAFRGEM
jgi:type I restriction enzyme S subunit